jgi:MFS family permease
LEEQSATQKMVQAPKRKPFSISALFATTFASLKHRNYRTFFFGQIISLVGTWTQSTAQGWLVYDLTKSIQWTGIVIGLGSAPMLILSLIGGGVADRFQRRKILVITQSASVIPPLILGLLILTGAVQVWHIAVAATMLGIINAFDMPARQAFVIELVGREDLMNAIGLNSGMFNTARIIGPAVAGIVMVSVGMGYCFVLNGLSFIAAVIALLIIRLPAPTVQQHKGSAWKHLTSGVKYILSDRRLSGLFALVAIVGVLGFSYVALLPAFVRDILGKSEKEYASVLTFVGFGSVAGALFVATVAEKAKSKKRILTVGIVILSVSLFTISLTKEYSIALIPLPFIGMGMIMFLSTANTLVQTNVSDEYRGRVMGMWTLVFGGSMPVGAVLSGTVAEYLGVPLTIQICSCLCIIAAISAAILSRRKNAQRGSPAAFQR